MESDEIGRMIYLSLLALAVGGYFFVSNKQSLGKLAKDVAIWSLIFVGLIAGYGLWGDVRDDISPRQSYVQDAGEVSVPRSPDGHYYLTLDINGAPVRFVVDTGASEMVLSLADARRAGIDVEGLAFLGRANTANGTVSTAAIRLDNVTLGPISDERFPASVNSGEMSGSLLGMRYLNRFESLEIQDGEMILKR